MSTDDVYVYVSAAPQDVAALNRLKQELRAAGVVLGKDRNGGLRPAYVRNAITGARRMIVCFSAGDGNTAGYDANDLAHAIDHMRANACGDWLLLVKFGACSIPSLPIATDELLSDFHSFDLATDWKGGVAQLLDALGVAPAANPAPRSEVRLTGNAMRVGQDFIIVNDGTAPNSRTVADIKEITIDRNYEVQNTKRGRNAE
jgi:hypothetical protein